MHHYNQFAYNYEPNDQQPIYYMNQPNNLCKSDRRQWNKSNTEINLDYPDPEKIAANQKRYDDYLFNLHLNNKIVKMATQKDKKDEKLEKLEGGFSLYVNGAHRKSEKYTPRITVNKSASGDQQKRFNLNLKSSKSNLSRLENLNNIEFLFGKSHEKSTNKAATGGDNRKKWSRCSFILKTDDGCEIKINGPAKANKHTKPVSKSDITSTTKTKNKTPANHDDLHYSDDFESDTDDFEPNVNKSETVVNNANDSQNSEDKNLIETVKFSDVSSDDSIDEEVEEENKNTNGKNTQEKKIVYHLNKSDIKNLRESINVLNLRDSAQIPDEANEFQKNFDTYDNSKNPFVTNKRKPGTGDQKKSNSSYADEEDDIEEEIEQDVEEDKKTSVCDLLIKKVACMDPKERVHLIEFLNKLDSSAK